MCDCNCDGGDNRSANSNDFFRVITESAIYEMPLRDRAGNADRIGLLTGDDG